MSKQRSKEWQRRLHVRKVAWDEFDAGFDPRHAAQSRARRELATKITLHNKIAMWSVCVMTVAMAILCLAAELLP